MKTVVACMALSVGFVFTLATVTLLYDKAASSTDIGNSTAEALRLAYNLRNRYRRFIIFPRLRSEGDNNDNTTDDCGSSSDDFPEFFTKEQVQHGGIILVICIGIYCFTLLAMVCNNYFIPCVERICEVLNLSPNVTAATFMSVATSTPELFVNLIGTFITKSDMGVGTIVGSSMFNAVGVAAVGGLAASSPMILHWWPVTRDVIIYVGSVCLLVAISWDGIIFWYEGLILFIVYFIYFVVMFNNERLTRFLFRCINKSRVNDVEKGSPTIEHPPMTFSEEKKPIDEEDDDWSLFKIPEGTIWIKIFYFYSWPIRLILTCCIPSVKQFPRLFPVTFILCIVFIGLNSYMVSWMIAIIGSLLNLPDAVLGLIFLAPGGCLPEGISITIMARRGEGSMGVSNSLGANTMNILLSLGMPWFLKTITMGMSDSSFLVIQSGSIEYTIAALIPIALILYLVLYFNKFKLNKRVGIILLGIYLICATLAIVSEMVFFKNNDECVSL